MPSEPGSQEPLDNWYQHHAGRMPVVPVPTLTLEEQDCIADGEPYCFRCGKPASSFPEYESQADEYGAASNYVVREEGTYNPETNRFACDACYIAIGMPVGEAFDAYGWRAP